MKNKLTKLIKIILLIYLYFEFKKIKMKILFNLIFKNIRISIKKYKYKLIICLL